MAKSQNRYIDKEFLRDVAMKFGDNWESNQVSPEERAETSQVFMQHMLLLKRTQEHEPSAFNDYLQQIAKLQRITQNASEEDIVKFQSGVIDYNNHHLLQQAASKTHSRLQQDIERLELEGLFRAARYDGIPSDLSDDIRLQLQTSLMYASEIGGAKAESSLAKQLSMYKNNFAQAMANPKVQGCLSVVAMTASLAAMNPVGIAIGVGKLLNTGPGRKLTDAIGHATENFLVEGVGIPQTKIDSAKEWFSEKYNGFTNNPVVQKLKFPVIGLALVAGGTAAAVAGDVFSTDIVSTIGEAADSAIDATASEWEDLKGDVSEFVGEQSAGEGMIPDTSSLAGQTAETTAQATEASSSTTAAPQSSAPNTPETSAANTPSTTDCQDTYAQAFTHNVVAGDTLSELVADKYEALTGDKPTQGQIWNMVYEVAEHNNIGNVDLIRVGDTIVFPEGLEFTNEKFDPSVAMPEGTATAYDIKGQVIVEPGQTLTELAQKHHQALTGRLPSPTILAEMVDQIGEHNNLHDKHHLRIGQTISFPNDLANINGIQGNLISAATPDCHFMNQAFHTATISDGSTLNSATADYYQRLTGEQLSDTDIQKLAERVAEHNNIASIQDVAANTAIVFPDDLEIQAFDLGIEQQAGRAFLENIDDALATLNDESISTYQNSTHHDDYWHLSSKGQSL